MVRGRIWQQFAAQGIVTELELLATRRKTGEQRLERVNVSSPTEKEILNEKVRSSDGNWSGDGFILV